jgi:hypothetical protein
MDHHFEQGGNGCAGRLLKPRDGLCMGIPSGFSIGDLELRNLEPPQQRLGGNAHRPGCLLHISLREQSGDCFFLFTSDLRPNFAPWPVI